MEWKSTIAIASARTGPAPYPSGPRASYCPPLPPPARLPLPLPALPPAARPPAPLPACLPADSWALTASRAEGCALPVLVEVEVEVEACPFLDQPAIAGAGYPSRAGERARGGRGEDCPPPALRSTVAPTATPPENAKLENACHLRLRERLDPPACYFDDPPGSGQPPSLLTASIDSIDFY